MISAYPLVATLLIRSLPRNRLTRMWRILALSLVLVAPSQAQPPQALTPFSITYQVSHQGHQAGEATQTLSKEQDHYTLRFYSDLQLFFFKHTREEVSQFSWHQDRIRPHQYSIKTSGIGKKRNAQLVFDWDKHEVENHVSSPIWRAPLEEDTQDRLSHQLMLKHGLQQGKTEFHFTVADGGKIKAYHYALEETETLETPLGQIDALRIKRIRNNQRRQTWLWFAPSLDYALVRIRQTKDGQEQADSIISQLNPAVEPAQTPVAAH